MTNGSDRETLFYSGSSGQQRLRSRQCNPLISKVLSWCKSSLSNKFAPVAYIQFSNEKQNDFLSDKYVQPCQLRQAAALLRDD